MVLVHGAWHGAWCWEKVASLVGQAGHPVIAKDLPGHGLNARAPQSFGEFPRSGAFASEPSPVSGITLSDYVSQIVQTVEALLSQGSAPPVLVGHSMGGIAIQAAAEALGPTKLHRLVYLAAFMPANNASMATYSNGSTQADSKLRPLFIGNPGKVGAIRIDPRSSDSVYASALTAAFYVDVDEDIVMMARQFLTPDIPLKPIATPIQISSKSWGAIPRLYIRANMDAAVRPATQELMISQADAFTPGNLTRVIRVDSSHSPFFSQPRAIAEALIDQASI